MKSKIAITVLILSCSLFAAQGKTVFQIIVQNAIPDTINCGAAYTYCYEINNGDSLELYGQFHFHNTTNYWAPGNVDWYRNGSFIGNTYGYQIIKVAQAGLYTANSDGYTSIYTISLTVINPTGISENTTPHVLITQNANENSLSIKGLSETGNHQLEIFSLTGSLVKRETIPAYQKEYVISLAAIKRGYYIINISDNERNFSKKLFLE